MCKDCKSYEKQSDTLEKALSNWTSKKEKSGEEKVLSSQAKTIIMNKLKEK